MMTFDINFKVWDIKKINNQQNFSCFAPGFHKFFFKWNNERHFRQKENLTSARLISINCALCASVACSTSRSSRRFRWSFLTFSNFFKAAFSCETTLMKLYGSNKLSDPMNNNDLAFMWSQKLIQLSREELFLSKLLNNPCQTDPIYL